MNSVAIALAAFLTCACNSIPAGHLTPNSASRDPSALIGHLTKPRIVRRLIPFPPKRKRQMAAYSERHYGEHVWRLRHPQVIVEHWAESSSASSVYNTFAPDTPDPELHELPNVCAHFVVSGSGKIIKLVPLSIRCRHTVGLNWTAIGVEHTGFSDAEVLDDHAQ